MVISRERERRGEQREGESIGQGRCFAYQNVQVCSHNHCYYKNPLQVNIHSNNNNNNKNNKSRNRAGKEGESRERTLPGHERA